MDKLEDFLMNQNYKIPTPCFKYIDTDHFAGMDKDCSWCVNYRKGIVR